MTMNFKAYQHAQSLPGVDFNQISDILKESDTFVWLTIKDPSPTQLKKIQAQFQLHELAIEDASSAHQRPKLEEYGDTLFLAIHTARLKGEESVYGELHVFIAKQFVILIQHGGASRYDQAQSRCENSPELFKDSPGFALYAVLDYLVDQFIHIAGHLQKQLDDLESAIFKSKLNAPLIEHLYELKRDVARLHNAASPIADICAELVRLHPDIVTKDLLPYYRDVQDHVERITRTTVMLRETLSDAMQVNLALITVRQNEVVQRLAGWGAILAIPTMVFSMYGMNFKHMPEYNWEFGYPATLLLTAYACHELYCKLKKSGWL